MFRIVICEDDLSQRELLKGFLYKVFEEIQEDLDLIEFESGEESKNITQLGRKCQKKIGQGY